MVSLAMAFHASSMMSTLWVSCSARIFASKAFMMQSTAIS